MDILYFSIVSWLGTIVPIILVVWFVIKMNSIDKSMKEISKKLDK